MEILKSRCPKVDPCGNRDLTIYKKESVPAAGQIRIKPTDITRGKSEVIKKVIGNKVKSITYIRIYRLQQY
jgi:hypothetical protein